MNKIYLQFEIEKGYPAGKNIYYECTICNLFINSMPDIYDECKCGNISIDAVVGRITIEANKKIKIFKTKK